MRRMIRKKGFGALGLGMVAATITLIGVVATQSVRMQDNREIASTSQQSSQESVPSSIERPADVDVVAADLNTNELEQLDAELDGEFNF